MFSIVVFSSSGGGNFESLIEHRNEHNYQLSMLITDRQCGAIDKAIKHNIPYVCSADKFNMFEIIDENVVLDTDLIVLAGFFPILPEWFCDKWAGKIINSHPSLLPKFGGKGMYGVRVHNAVMKAKEAITGCTIHFVNEQIDAGSIIAQVKMPIDYSLTPWQLGGEVFNLETKLLPFIVGLFANGVLKTQAVAS